MDLVRVLALGPIPPPYHGVATYLRDLLDSHDFNGVELQHVDTSDRRDASNLGKWDAENLSLGFSNLAELAERCTRSDAQVVYLPLSQNVPAFLRDALFILEARLLGKRVVIHLHGGYFRTLYDQHGAAFQAIARATLRLVSGAVVLGADFRGIFAGLVPESRIFVVENGVPDLFAHAVNPREGAGATVLYMSTLTRTKGILELIRAIGLARSAHPDVRLRVAGSFQESELRQETETLVHELKLESAVSFVGNVTGAAKADFLRGGDLFCLPTRYPFEGQPLAILEAMSAGLPVLTMDRGVIASTVVDGVSGRVLPQDATPEKLAETLAAMLSDRAHLRDMGRRGRTRFLARYTLHVCHLKLAGVFQAVTSDLR